MSKSLIKANYVKVENDKSKKRVIDSNQAVFERLQFLKEVVEIPEQFDEEYSDEFVEGLDAEQVDALFAPQSEEVAPPPTVNAEEIIAEANAQVEQMLAEANAKADEILAAARTQAEDIKAKAFEDGRNEGSEAGYNEGLAKTRAMEEDLQNRMQQLEAEYEERLCELEPQFIEVLTGIYTHIFNVDFSDKTDVILYLLKDAIRNSNGSKNFFVHVSREDYDEVVAARGQLESGLPSSCSVEIIEDITLGKNSCFVETESGIFDCSLGTELELLNKELKLLSYKA